MQYNEYIKKILESKNLNKYTQESIKFLMEYLNYLEYAKNNWAPVITIKGCAISLYRIGQNGFEYNIFLN